VHQRRFVSPVVRHVRTLDGEYYMLREVAEQLGIPINALRGLIHKHPDALGPSSMTYLGRIKIYLFTAADVEALHRHLEWRRGFHPDLDDLHGGRPSLWSHAEQEDRHVRHASAYYWRKRAERLEAAGRGEEARAATARWQALRAGLTAQYDQRVAARQLPPVSEMKD
jgi:hypothetical protein